MSSRIMIGNKGVVRVGVYVLILCFLLIGCSGKTDSNKNDGIDGPSATEPSTNPEDDGNDIPDYGIELPDDNWD